MIIDSLDNVSSYRGVAPRWWRAFDFLRSADLANLPLGRHDLDGDNLFALVQEYQTRDLAESKWEAHRRYCDVQYVASGRERMGVAPLSRMNVVTPYDADKDVAFFDGPGDWIVLDANMFAIFTPNDVHRPCVAAGASERVKKIVIKALLD